MDIKKIAIHELIKLAKSNIVNTRISDQVVPIDEQSKSLVLSLLGSYNGDKISYARFDRSEGKYFPYRLNQYRSSERDDNSFISFTENVVSSLVDFIRPKILASGGYLLFTEYFKGSTDFIAVFYIRDTEGKLLRRTPNSYEVSTVEYLDTNHLAMACRINENNLNSSDINYLSFTQGKKGEVSDYFTDWICVLKLESSTEYTRALYQLINSIERPKDRVTGREMSVDEVRNVVYEHAKGNTQGIIDIEALSEQLYSDPKTIRRHADENEIAIDTEFKYDKREIKRFVQVYVNRDGINIKFSRGDAGTKVRPSEENENMVIIESGQFARELKRQLENG